MKFPLLPEVIIFLQEPTISFQLDANLNNVRLAGGGRALAAREPLKNPGGSQNERKNKTPQRHEAPGGAGLGWRGASGVPAAHGTPFSPGSEAGRRSCPGAPGPCSRLAPGALGAAPLQHLEGSRSLLLWLVMGVGMGKVSLSPGQGCDGIPWGIRHRDAPRGLIAQPTLGENRCSECSGKERVWSMGWKSFAHREIAFPA